MLRLRTFGGCFLERDGVRLDGLSGQRKGLGLLALLAAAGDNGVGREVASAYLWPESDEARAAASLKQLVHSLRQQLGSPDVLLGPAALRLNPALVTSDLAEFRDALLRGDADAAVELYAGPFLDGFLIRGTDAFERWADAERAARAADFAAALETLAERAAARGDARGAVHWWRRRQGVDPLSGRVAVGLMRALDAVGDRAGALRHARIHEALLRQEVGPSAADPAVAALAAELARAPSVTAEPAAPLAAPLAAPRDAAHEPRAEPAADARPDDRTRAPALAGSLPDESRSIAPGAPPAAGARPLRTALAAAGLLAVLALSSYAVQRGDAGADDDRGAAPGAAAATRPAPDRSVAVLPFANTSGDPADEPFADGLTDELIGALGQVAGLKVAPRTSAFALKGKGLDVRTVADTLGVATALEGSVRRAGERLRITVALVSAAENRVLWSETYDRELKDVFAVQQEIARSVVRALQITLVAGPGAAPVRPPTADLVAYELYLRGQFFRYQLSGDALQRAVGLFEQAIARDPGFARAHAGLADAHALLVLFGDRPPREGFRRARAAAVTALTLDSTLAQAHASLAHIETAHDWNWASAGRRFERATALDPASTTIRHWRALWLFDQRRFEDAAALLQQTLASDPLSTPVRLTLGRMHVSMRQPNRAISYLNGAIELNPRLSLAHQQLGYAYLQKGMPAEAVAAFARAAALGGLRDSAQLAYAHAVTGRRAEAEQIVRALIGSSDRRYVSPFDVAVAYVGLGDSDAAFRWLERAYEEHAAGMDTIAITPALAPLYADPRWTRLLLRMGLAA